MSRSAIWRMHWRRIHHSLMYDWVLVVTTMLAGLPVGWILTYS